MAVRPKAERSAINRFLGTHGLPPLESGSGLLAALGYMVRDHEHFRTLVIRCEPEMRQAMYESMKPYVRFELHPLDWYVAESGRLAEAKNLPVLKEDGTYEFPSDARPTGLCTCKELTSIYFTDDMTPMCRACRRPVPDPDQARAQDALLWHTAKQTLTVTCMKCTKSESFPGLTKTDCIVRAREAGWAVWEHEGQKREICPDCPASAPTRHKEAN